MNIGNAKLDNNIFLAPMAGVTDLNFRIICREMGAGLLVSEMVSAKGIYYGDKGTERLMTTDSRERPLALQIFGSDPQIMGDIVKNKLNHRNDIDIIDINMGCPAPKIVKNGDGSALMKDPETIKRILHEVIKVSQKPVTIKIRMGWDQESINGLEIAKIADQMGVAAITLHGRTRDMFYSGKADWDYIKLVKDSVRLPVIANGDVFTAQDGIDLLRHTGCDAIAIARGAMGNPWIFRSIVNLIEGRGETTISSEEKILLAIRHLDMTCQTKGNNVGLKEMRKHLAWYIKGMKNSSEMKNKINTISDKEELIEELMNYLEKLKISE